MSDFEPKPNDTNYQYKGIPLTATIAQDLISKLFAGKLVERQILVDEVMRFHLAGGGLKASAQNPKITFDKAFFEMNRRGANKRVTSPLATGVRLRHAISQTVRCPESPQARI